MHLECLEGTKHSVMISPYFPHLVDKMKINNSDAFHDVDRTA